MGRRVAPTPRSTHARGDRRRRSHGLVLGAVLAVAALLTTGCWAFSEGYTGPEEGTKVLVAGDSHVVRTELGGVPPDDPDAATLITDHLASNGYRVNVNAMVGATATDGQGIVARWDAEVTAIPDVAVIAYGTNDLRSVGSVPDGAVRPVTLNDVLTELDQLVADLDALGVGCIAALTVAKLPAYPNLDTLGEAWNVRLASNGLLGHVEPWDEVAEAHPEIFLLNGEDDLHFTVEEGGPLYRESILAAAAGCSAP